MAEHERLSARPAARTPAPPPSPGPARARVWVLDDPRAGTASQAIGIAERLEVPFRRIPLEWNWLAHMAGLAPRGSLLGVSGRVAARRLNPAPGAARPLVVLSSGSRAAPVALWLKARLGCRLVHCMRPGGPAALARSGYDLLVVPEHDRPGAGRGRRGLAANILPVLGAPHRVGPQALAQAAAQWGERLDHLPHPRVALLVGGRVHGSDMEPARAHALGRAVARVVNGLGGSVLATTSRRTGREASEALAAGLGQVMHLLYRWGEPGENPYLGFLAAADAVVVTADSVSMLSEACATQAPVFVALPELVGSRHRRFADSLLAAGQARAFHADVSPWPRTPLDEAGRVASEIRRRFPLG